MAPELDSIDFKVTGATKTAITDYVDWSFSVNSDIGSETGWKNSATSSFSLTSLKNTCYYVLGIFWDDIVKQLVAQVNAVIWQATEVFPTTVSMLDFNGNQVSNFLYKVISMPYVDTLKGGFSVIGHDSSGTPLSMTSQLSYLPYDMGFNYNAGTLSTNKVSQYFPRISTALKAFLYGLGIVPAGGESTPVYPAPYASRYTVSTSLTAAVVKDLLEEQRTAISKYIAEETPDETNRLETVNMTIDRLLTVLSDNVRHDSSSSTSSSSA